MNIEDMLEQAKKVQARLAAAQDQIEQTEVEGASGAGMVKVKLAGKGILRRITIDPALLNPAEAEMLEDLIMAAHAEARAKLEAATAAAMSVAAAGMPLPPGFKLPFG